MPSRPYLHFIVETFELGSNQWHARVWRRDYQAIVIDGYIFGLLELGIAWPSAACAFDDACCLVDRLVS
jgi:hypothetical protein